MITNSPRLEVLEAFHETPETNPKPSFVLSETIRALGYDLTDQQALMLDIGQQLHAKFKMQTSVPLRQVTRIASFYHGIRQVDSIRVVKELAGLGIVSVIESEKGRSEMKLSMKVKGPTAEQVAVNGNAIGSLCVKKETVRESYRAQAASFAFRNAALRKAAQSETSEHTDCSISAAVVLSVLAEHGTVDQIRLDRLQTHCQKEGLSVIDISCACGELYAMNAVEFFWDEGKNRCYMKSLYPTGVQFQVEPDDAVSCLVERQVLILG